MTSDRPKIPLALVDPVPSDAAALAEILAADHQEPALAVQRIETAEELHEAVRAGGCELVVAAAVSAGFSAFDAVSELARLKAAVPVIGVRKPGEHLDVVDGMRQGLLDVVDFANAEHLRLVVQRTLENRTPKDIPRTPPEHDFTGLYSRLRFLELLRESLQREDAHGTPRALLYIQLDTFAWINESFGIVTGDEFLRSIAATIGENLAEDDLAARYHGGTFVVLARGGGINELEEKARAICEAIGAHIFDYGQEVISSTASIGLALVTDTTGAGEALITSAFKACENAKADGGNSVYWYGAEETAAGDSGDQEAWITRIRHAFENDMFSLLFQPIVSLKGDDTPRYEVLVRMLNEDGETIPPGAFLPFAERAGLMTDIDRWVISHSIYSAERQRKAGVDPELFLKLSGKTLVDKNMASWISRAFAESTCPGSVVVFEITETMCLLHLAQARKLIRQLKQLGCKIGIDHFGTHATSLRTLAQLDLDYLKIDGSLIRGLPSNEQHQEQVRQIVAAAREREIGIIAESIQEASSLPLLWQFEVQLVQGYFLQQPQPRMDFDFNELVF